jgi:hypothetical protein
MISYNEVNEDNFLLFAAQHYYKPRLTKSDEFLEDLNRFKYIKRLLNRYECTGKINERLVLNHIIVIFNVFDIYPGLKMLEVKLNDNQWPIIKPFIVKIRAVPDEVLSGIDMDKYIVDKLREI